MALAGKTDELKFSFADQTCAVESRVAEEAIFLSFPAAAITYRPLMAASKERRANGADRTGAEASGMCGQLPNIGAGEPEERGRNVPLTTPGLVRRHLTAALKVGQASLKRRRRRRRRRRGVSVPSRPAARASASRNATTPTTRAAPGQAGPGADRPPGNPFKFSSSPHIFCSRAKNGEQDRRRGR